MAITRRYYLQACLITICSHLSRVITTLSPAVAVASRTISTLSLSASRIEKVRAGFVYATTRRAMFYSGTSSYSGSYVVKVAEAMFLVYFIFIIALISAQRHSYELL